MNVFVEPSKDGGYQIEWGNAVSHAPQTGFMTQEEAIAEAKRQGHTPLVFARDFAAFVRAVGLVSP